MSTLFPFFAVLVITLLGTIWVCYAQSRPPVGRHGRRRAVK